MRIIAATFMDRKAAQAVLEYILSRFDLTARDAEVAPLATSMDEQRPGIVLAGRFTEQRAPEVHRLVTEHKGEVVVDIDEGQTKTSQSRVNASPEMELPETDPTVRLTSILFGR